MLPSLLLQLSADWTLEALSHVDGQLLLCTEGWGKDDRVEGHSLWGRGEGQGISYPSSSQAPSALYYLPSCCDDASGLTMWLLLYLFLFLQLKDGSVSLNDVVVLQPAATASHPYLSAQHHSELLLEAVSATILSAAWAQMWQQIWQRQGRLGSCWGALHIVGKLVAVYWSSMTTRHTPYPVGVCTCRVCAATHPCVVCCVQGYPLEERLLELRCSRYFYVEELDTFLPVLDTPKDFNKQLKSSAGALAATKDPRCVENPQVTVFTCSTACSWHCPAQ